MATINEKRINSMVDDAVEKQHQKYYNAAGKLYSWHCPSLSKENFWRLLQSITQAIMSQRGVFHPYVVDENNREIINQMYLYVIGSSECKWNINKGIYLGGKVGSGKTLLLQAFCEILHVISGLVVEMIPATQLYRRILDDGINSLATRPLFIDDLGREQLEICEFGIKIRPISDLMALRYNSGARTFFTSNFHLETLSKGHSEKGELIGYGQYIGERIQEMTNIVEMPGDSRREKWENIL